MGDRMNRWDGFEEFVQVVECGTFSAAARLLNVSKGHVSQQVSKLEDRLGSRLLHRTTRKITLTEAGQIFYRQCRAILEAVEQAERSVTTTHHQIKGRLRICSPHWLGEVVLIPALAEFMRLHPELDVHVEISSRSVDLIDGDYDLAIQVGERRDINVVNHKLAPTRFFLVASPSYLETYPAPEHPEDIAKHKTLLFEDRGMSKPWKLTEPGSGALRPVKVKSQWRSNSGHALRAAAREGLGLAYLPDYYVVDDIKAGALVSILPEWTSLIRQVVAIYQHRENVSQKIITFIDFIETLFTHESQRLSRSGG